MRLLDDIKLDYDDVLIAPKRSKLSSRSEANLERQIIKFPHSRKTWSGVPIIAANMDSVGTFRVAKVLSQYKMLTCLHKFIEWEDVSDNLQEYLIISSGITSEDRSKLMEAVYRYPNIPFLCLDVANGYTQHFFKAIEKTRETFPDHILIAGNVATPEAAEQVILSGADIVKVGIGPGKACSTRFVTGVGYPQLSAVIETADAVHGLSGHIIADGGCKTPGDVAKAFCAGADFVMLGYLFAGHDETGQDFYGMSSAKAQTKYYGEVKEYRASEGLELQIASRGPLRDTIQQILGGLRSCCSYIGASEIKHMPKCATLVRVNRIK